MVLTALTVNAKIATVTGSIPVSSGTVESEGGGGEAVSNKIFKDEPTWQQITEKEVDKILHTRCLR
jgi:hypothetical protein